MQKLVLCAGFLVSIVLAQREYCFLTDISPAIYQSGILTADSSLKVNIKPSDEIATDDLQESLYVQILAEIKNPQSRSLLKTPANINQLLQKCRHYYPKAEIRSNTLIIPYPPQKVEEFKEIKYKIPSEYFNQDNKITSLQPEIELYLNKDEGTLMINNSYLISFYRSPGIKNNSLQEYKKMLQHLFNLLLPYTNKNREKTAYNNKIIVHYKGYKEHDIIIESEDKFYAFWESLNAQGSLYFFPSKIDDLENSIIVYGLLYVMKDDHFNVYHFGELRVIFSKQFKSEGYVHQLDFYPFVINKQIGN